MTVDGKVVEEHLVEKSKAEWTKEDKENVLKDANVINILFNSLDYVLTNYVLSCKTAIELWNRLQVHCEGTKPVKKNMKSLLIQEYEYFEARSGETLTDTYDRFTKLMNDMAMHDKYCDNEDVNTKFIRSLPEMYDEKSTAIREANDLDEITLEAVYGKLRAYDLEKQQRKGRGEGISKSIALMIQYGKEKLIKDQSGANEKKDSCRKKDKKKVSSESESSDIDSDNEDMESEADIKELMAMFARSFRKGKFNKRRFSKNFFNRGEDRKYEKGKSSFVKLDKANVKCFNCSELGHFASECKKPMNLRKGKALMTTQKDWADSSSSEDEIDYDNIALMAISSEKSGSPKSSNQVSIYSVESFNNLDSDGIKSIQAEIKNLLANFRSLTSETDRLRDTNTELIKRNNFLESELVEVEHIKEKSNKNKHNYCEILKAYDFVKKELEAKKERFKLDSCRTVQTILNNQSLYQTTCLGYTEEEDKNQNLYPIPVLLSMLNLVENQ